MQGLSFRLSSSIQARWYLFALLEVFQEDPTQDIFGCYLSEITSINKRSFQENYFLIAREANVERGGKVFFINTFKKKAEKGKEISQRVIFCQRLQIMLLNLQKYFMPNFSKQKVTLSKVFIFSIFYFYFPASASESSVGSRPQADQCDHNPEK